MFPKQSKITDKFIAKEKFLSYGDFDTKLKNAMTNDIAKIIATNKLSSTTLNVEAGKIFPEIMVLHIFLKNKEYEIKLLDIMDKSIRAAYVLFVLEYNNTFCYSLAYKDKTIGNINITKRWTSPWGTELSLEFEGRSIDNIYESLIRQISNGKLLKSTELNLKEKVDKTISVEKIEKQIKMLEIKVINEPQFKRKLELKDKIKALKEQL